MSATADILNDGFRKNLIRNAVSCITIAPNPAGPHSHLFYNPVQVVIADMVTDFKGLVCSQNNCTKKIRQGFPGNISNGKTCSSGTGNQSGQMNFIDLLPDENRCQKNQ